MGQCSCLKHSIRKPASLTTLDECSTQNKRNSNQINETFHKLSQQYDPYYNRFQICEQEFKDYPKSKIQEYYMNFFKFIVLSEQIGNISEYRKKQPLYKGLTMISLLRDKIKRDFKVGIYNIKDQKRPITDEDILIYTIENSQSMINAFQTLEQDAYYEELFPILSFSFMEMKNKFIVIVNELDQLRIISQSKHQMSMEIIG